MGPVRALLVCGAQKDRCSRGSRAGLRALLVVSLLPVSEINQRFRPGFQPGRRRVAGMFTCASQLEATARSYGK